MHQIYLSYWLKGISSLTLHNLAARKNHSLEHAVIVHHGGKEFAKVHVFLDVLWTTAILPLLSNMLFTRALTKAFSPTFLVLHLSL